jgi:hypothetical protein
MKPDLLCTICIEFGESQIGRGHRLGNLATVNIDLNSMIANLASEEGIFHVRNNGSGADNKTLDGNYLVDI